MMTAEGISASRFRGKYDQQLQYPGVYHVASWIAAGHPISPHMLFVGAMYGTDFQTTAEASTWLDQHCLRESTESFVKNPGYELKGRLFGPPGLALAD